MEFQDLGSRKVVVNFDDGHLSSDGGGNATKVGIIGIIGIIGIEDNVGRNFGE